ncbi:NRDE family protein [Aequorivita echinoideorum]|uniref:NRDE family protein n=1 Tax=Aequorivita echinoideorum TaxID=1549647 RepID=A0ABS5S9N6_9FLAO|nr:NRDE family protein [Aequorivita echinoideorum]MBT0609134.1 NRDE family protein [Aequorivita echinoideorum]
MCTVTFVPKSNSDFILTSNRDEAPGRETIPPKIYIENGLQLLYPKDALAGGSWIGASERKRVACLMNGGFEAHVRKANYRKSRGLVLTDFLKVNSLISAVADYNFTEIEPFTCIFIDYNVEIKLYQLVWDGAIPHFTEKPLISHIWSSSPLYPKNLREKREAWFSEFLIHNNTPSENELLSFHNNAGDGDLHSNLRMDRGFVKSKSITQIIKSEDVISMQYFDLQSERKNEIVNLS